MKPLLLSIGLLISVTCLSQPYLEVGFGNTLRPSAGFLFPKGLLRKVDLNVSFDMPYDRDGNSQQTSFTAGRLLIDKITDPRWQFLVAAGASYYHVLYFDSYDDAGKLHERLSKHGWKPVIMAQAGINAGVRGRIFVQASYSDRFRAGVGIRAFFAENMRR